MKIRQTKTSDFRAVEWLTREAFWNHTGPGCDEHYIVHKTRDLPCYKEDLTFVAEEDSNIIGYIALYQAELHTDDEVCKILTICPVAVHPFHQKKGIGAKLIEHAHTKAKALGYGAVILYGDPKYYKRFGFADSKQYSITTESGDNFDAFLALELIDGYLDNKSGYFKELHEINLSQEALHDFDQALLADLPL